MEEVWKDVLGYEGRYQVSDRGNVRSIISGKALSPNLMNHGYTCVHLYAGGRSTRKVRTVHQLVAEAFIPNPNHHREVNHKNFVRADNSVSNLEWVTRKENVSHALAAGRRVKPEKKVAGIRLRDGKQVSYPNQIAAEIGLRGAQTGGISWALKHHRPIYGYVWWLA